MRWTVWPLVDRPLVSLAVATLLIAVAYAVYAALGAWYWSLAASLTVVIAMWRYLLPITFEVTPRGLKQESFIQTASTGWADIHAVRQCSSGVLLLPGEEDTPLDALRGLFLPWGPHRTELLQLVSLYLTGEEYDDV